MICLANYAEQAWNFIHHCFIHLLMCMLLFAAREENSVFQYVKDCLVSEVTSILHKKIDKKILILQILGAGCVLVMIQGRCKTACNKCSSKNYHQLFKHGTHLKTGNSKLTSRQTKQQDHYLHPVSLKFIIDIECICIQK